MSMPFTISYADEGNGLHAGAVRMLVNDELYNNIGDTELTYNGTESSFEECVRKVNNIILNADTTYCYKPVEPQCRVNNPCDNGYTIYQNYSSPLIDGLPLIQYSFENMLGRAGVINNEYKNEPFIAQYNGSVSNMHSNDISSKRKLGISVNGQSNNGWAEYNAIVSLGTPTYTNKLNLGQTSITEVYDPDAHSNKKISYTLMFRLLPSSSFSSIGGIIPNDTLIKAVRIFIFSNDSPSSLGYDWSVQCTKNYRGDFTTSEWLGIEIPNFSYTADPLSSGGYSQSSEGFTGIDPATGQNVGGDGTFTLQADDVPPSPLPDASMSIIGVGSGTAYIDTGVNIKNLMQYMWTHADDIVTNLKKIIANPIDSILGLHLIPFAPAYGTPTEVFLGNVGTTIRMSPLLNPYYRFDMGHIDINKYWGSALDFNPFTEFSIYLPYIGFRRLNTDELMGSRAHLWYDFDAISGACVAHLEITRTDPITKQEAVTDSYNWSGNCAMQVPVTANNYQGLYGTIASAVIGTVAGIAGGIAGAEGFAAAAAGVGGGIAQSLSTTANHVLNGGSKIRVDKEGSAGGAHGFLSSQYAFIERITPRQSLASNYREVLGYPSNTTMKLSSCSGFTQIEDINLENFPCTSDEKDELETLLKGGVLF